MCVFCKSSQYSAVTQRIQSHKWYSFFKFAVIPFESNFMLRIKITLFFAIFNIYNVKMLEMNLIFATMDTDSLLFIGIKMYFLIQRSISKKNIAQINQISCVTLILHKVLSLLLPGGFIAKMSFINDHTDAQQNKSYANY